MQQFAPEAIRGGIYFAHRNQDTPADDRPCIVGALARGPVFLTPAHRQDFVDRITLRLAANARPHTDRERIGNARFETVGELALKGKNGPVAGSLITKEVPPPASARAAASPEPNASAVISCGRAASVPSTATRAPTVSAAGSRRLALLMSA